MSICGLKRCWFLFQMFRKLYSFYIDVMCNFFYNSGDRIQFRWVVVFRGLLFFVVCSFVKGSDFESEGENVFLSDFEVVEVCFFKQIFIGIFNIGSRRRVVRVQRQVGFVYLVFYLRLVGIGVFLQNLVRVQIYGQGFFGRKFFFVIV